MFRLTLGINSMYVDILRNSMSIYKSNVCHESARFVKSSLKLKNLDSRHSVMHKI